MIAREVTCTSKSEHQLRVFVSLDMQLHRDAISRAMRMLRPCWSVCEIPPEWLDELILDHAPDVVVSTAIPPDVEPRVPMWILLYPEHPSGSIVSKRGARLESAQIGLAELIEVIDGLYG